ncbi:transcription factor S [Candidatus Woesearchaeota archaeon]|nr:transcription factor S [Candidatus Woesearchaeota archaeon]
MTLFCPKCGSLMKPKEKKGKKTMVCSCGYKTKDVEETKIKETMKKDAHSFEVVEEEKEALPLVEKECPKCGHKKAYFWEVQTRASDEPATQFFKCEKCKHIWRHYD